MELHTDLADGDPERIASWSSFFLRRYLTVAAKELAHPRRPMSAGWRAEIEQCVVTARAELARRGEEIA